MARRKTLKAATRDFDRLEGLKALAARLAAEIDICTEQKVLAQLSRQYRETLAEIDLIEGGIDDESEIATIILRNRQSTTD
jgi:hypothetical protein